MAGTSNRFTRGRKSPLAASPIAQGPGMERPEPPDDFTDEEKVIWDRITNACPPDWFTAESIHLLSKLCTLIDQTNQLESQYRRDGRKFLDKDDRLAYNAAAKLVAMYTTKLRLSPQSRWQPTGAGARMRDRAAHQPWDDDVDDAA